MPDDETLIRLLLRHIGDCLDETSLPGLESGSFVEMSDDGIIHLALEDGERYFRVVLERQHGKDAIEALEAAIQRNPEALKAYRGEDATFGAVWFRAVVDLLRAHVRSGGSLLDGLVHMLTYEHAAKTRAMRDECDAAKINLCPRCRRPLESSILGP